jgi:hypothetical protein
MKFTSDPSADIAAMQLSVASDGDGGEPLDEIGVVLMYSTDNTITDVEILSYQQRLDDVAAFHKALLALEAERAKGLEGVTREELVPLLHVFNPFLYHESVAIPETA